jgi:hypothetical protein
MLTPSTEFSQLGSVAEVNSSGRWCTISTSSQRVTSHMSMSGTYDTGSDARSRASAGYGSTSSSARVIAAPIDVTRSTLVASLGRSFGPKRSRVS